MYTHISLPYTSDCMYSKNICKPRLSEFSKEATRVKKIQLKIPVNAA